MSDFATCLSNIIGITPSECECLNFPDDWEAINESLTGNYIHGDMEYSVPLTVPSKGDCGEGSIIDNLIKAREQAINCFIDMYTVELELLKKKTFKDYSDTFGEWKNNTPISYLSGDWVGFTIKPDQFYKGAVLCITCGTLSIDCEEEFEIHVINTNDGSTVHTETVQGGVKSHFMMSVELPLYVGCQVQNYAIVYDANGCRPYDIGFDCGCPSTDKIPVWKRLRYFKSRGVQASSLEGIANSSVQNDKTHGLTIDFTLKCDGLSWLCSVDKDFWCKNAWGRIAARAMVIIANMKLISKLCQPGQVNFSGIMDSENLYKKNAYLTKKLQSLMEYLARTTPTDISHCYLCAPEGNYQIQDHLV